jgi:hypothetical protein
MVHAMISPYSCSPWVNASACEIMPTGRQGKGPGSAFGPGFVPLAAGSISVVYWVPGPVWAPSRPTPIQPAPNVTSLSVRLASPVLD